LIREILVEGTGLSDATPIHGEYIFPVVQKVTNYTTLTIGNHDIGNPSTVQFMLQKFIPHWGNRYITDNSYLKSTNSTIGSSPYYLRNSINGKKMLVLGYLYDFLQFANNTYVEKISVNLLRNYFTKAMNEPNVNLIVVVCHIDPQSGVELKQIYNAIRSFHPNKPLMMFAGHRHVKYFNWLDKNAFVIESGKYFEVLGQISFDFDDSTGFSNFQQQWVNTSVSNFIKMSGKTESTFQTKEGLQTKKIISYYYNKLGLNKTLGCSPGYFSPYANNSESLYNLWINQMIPTNIISRKK